MSKNTLSLNFEIDVKTIELLKWKQNSPKSKPVKIPKELIKKGEYTKLLELLENGANPNTEYDCHGETMSAVCVAVEYDKPNIVDLLCKFGANVNFALKKEDYPTYINFPIIMACNCLHFDVFRSLILNGADLNCLYHYHDTPLHLLLEDERDTDIFIKKLIEAGADINATNFHNQTPLMLAIKNRKSLEIIHTIASKTKEINAVDAFGKTALWYAVKKKNFTVVHILMKYGADPQIGEQMPCGVFPLEDFLREKSSSETTEVQLIRELFTDFRNKKQKIEEESKQKLEVDTEKESKQEINPKQSAETKQVIQSKNTYRICEGVPFNTVTVSFISIDYDSPAFIGFHEGKNIKILFNDRSEKNTWSILVPIGTEFPLILNQEDIENAMGKINQFYMRQFIEFLEKNNVHIIGKTLKQTTIVCVDYFLDVETYHKLLQHNGTTFTIDSHGLYKLCLGPTGVVSSKWAENSCVFQRTFSELDEICLSFSPLISGRIAFTGNPQEAVLFVKVLRKILDKPLIRNGLSYKDFSALGNGTFYFI